MAVTLIVAACKADPPPPTPIDPPHRATTSSSIAIENLEHQIEQDRRRLARAPNAPERKAELLGLLLAKADLLGDTSAFDAAVALAEVDSKEPEPLLLRARLRAALHRFADASSDLDSAERAGASASEVRAIRMTLMIATGRAAEAIPILEEEAKTVPSYTSMSALASAYAAVGRFDDGSRTFGSAIELYRSTSPFPVAWIYHAEGQMWADRSGDLRRARVLYERAVAHLPEYAKANVHLAALEAMLGQREAAIQRLERIVERVDDPESMVLLAELRRSTKPAEADVLMERAGKRYEALVAAYPLAFADHAANFYLSVGDTPRAFELAIRNLDNRENERSLALAILAARSANREKEACELVARAKSKPRSGTELELLLRGCDG